MPVMQTIDNKSKRQIEDLQLQVAHLLNEQERDNVAMKSLVDRIGDLRIEIDSLLDVINEADELIDYLNITNTHFASWSDNLETIQLNLERKLKDE